MDVAKSRDEEDGMKECKNGKRASNASVDTAMKERENIRSSERMAELDEREIDDDMAR